MRIDNKKLFSGCIEDAVRALGYKSNAHAVIERSVFAPPSIVKETSGMPIVNTVRRGSFDGLGRVERRFFIPPAQVKRLFDLRCTDRSARGVYVDDNFSAHRAFMACFDLRRHIATTHLCHVFPLKHSKDPRFFTALPNLVLVPSWLAKLTDSDASVMQALRWSVRCVYGFCPGIVTNAPRGPKHECTLCARPDHAPSEKVVRQAIGRSEEHRTKNYENALRKYRVTGRWAAAIDAGRGYDHMFLRPADPL